MTNAPAFRAIEIARIDASNRLRPVNPDAVAAYREERDRGSEWPAIRVVERGENFKLVHGLQRLETGKFYGETIVAEIRAAADYPTDADVRLAEIQDSFLRCELTKLDRAVHLAAWKTIYEAEKPVARHGGRREKSGRKSSDISDHLKSAPVFAERFSAAAARFLGVSDISVRRAIVIAEGIDTEIRARIALSDLADNAAELTLLAGQSAERQASICDLMLSSPPAVTSVADAIALLDKVPVVKLAGWQRLSDTFSRLPSRDRSAFFAAHEADFLEWLNRRGAQTKKVA